MKAKSIKRIEAIQREFVRWGNYWDMPTSVQIMVCDTLRKLSLDQRWKLVNLYPVLERYL